MKTKNQQLTAKYGRRKATRSACSLTVQKILSTFFFLFQIPFLFCFSSHENRGWGKEGKGIPVIIGLMPNHGESRRFFLIHADLGQFTPRREKRQDSAEIPAHRTKLINTEPMIEDELMTRDRLLLIPYQRLSTNLSL